MLLAPLIRRLECFAPLSDEDRRALLRQVPQQYCLAPQEDLALEGERPESVHVVLGGFAVRYKLLADGRRQIVGYCLPGDICDLRATLLRSMDHSIGALTAVRVASFQLHEVLELLDRVPRLARALWWAALVEESISREWIVNVGYRSAYERLAHLLCEVYLRLQAVGLARDHRCELPLRQSELADALALSAVHVNRTLMEMRRRGLVSFQNRQLVIHDMAALQRAANFNPNYLHLGERSPASPGALARDNRPPRMQSVAS